ncbi:MAG: hypothetical protein ACKODX_13040 [Gemmata sp.]
MGEFVKGKFPAVGEQLQGLLCGNGDGNDEHVTAADALMKKFRF